MPVADLARVVLVDGRPGLELSSIVRASGAGCSLAQTPAEAMELIASVSPGIVVIDVSMPGTGGTDLITAVKRLHPRLHVLALSSDPSAEKAARAAGADGFLELSSAPAGLGDAIRRLAP